LLIFKGTKSVADHFACTGIAPLLNLLLDEALEMIANYIA
jgi:hypothetical protein